MVSMLNRVSMAPMDCNVRWRRMHDNWCWVVHGHWSRGRIVCGWDRSGVSLGRISSRWGVGSGVSTFIQEDTLASNAVGSKKYYISQ